MMPRACIDLKIASSMIGDNLHACSSCKQSVHTQSPFVCVHGKGHLSEKNLVTVYVRSVSVLYSCTKVTYRETPYS